MLIYNVYVNFSRSNLIISVVNSKTNSIVLRKTCGSAGILNQWKGYDFSFLETSQKLSYNLQKLKIKYVNIIFKGSRYSLRRKYVLKGLLFNSNVTGIKILSIRDNTNIPFNGSKLRIRRIKRKRKSKNRLKMNR